VAHIRKTAIDIRKPKTKSIGLIDATRFVVASRLARYQPEGCGPRSSLTQRGEGVPVLALAFVYASTITMPAVPSTVTVAPSGMSTVAFLVPTTAGMPNSRATTAPCERMPPELVIRAPIIAK